MKAEVTVEHFHVDLNILTAEWLDSLLLCVCLYSPQAVLSHLSAMGAGVNLQYDTCVICCAPWVVQGILSGSVTPCFVFSQPGVRETGTESYFFPLLKPLALTLKRRSWSKQVYALWLIQQYFWPMTWKWLL